MFFAFIFDSVGGGEWLVLLAVILIVVGPKNLPAAARKIGNMMSTLRRAADEFKRQLMTMDQEMQRVAEDVKKDVIDIPSDETISGEQNAAGTSSDATSEGDTAAIEDNPNNVEHDPYGGQEIDETGMPINPGYEDGREYDYAYGYDPRYDDSGPVLNDTPDRAAEESAAVPSDGAVAADVSSVAEVTENNETAAV